MLAEHFTPLDRLITQQLVGLHHAIACQAAWLQLSAILQNASVYAAVPEQHAACKAVEQRWRLALIHLHEGRDCLVDATAPGGALSECAEIVSHVQAILDHLQLLFSRMRKQCPRLHLLSDAEMLQALEHSEQPQELPPGLLSKCIPGCHALDCKPAPAPFMHVLIRSVCTRKGDVLHLTDPVATGPAPLHEWLAALHCAMQAALQRSTVQCLAELQNSVDATAVVTGDYPQQAVALASSVHFTQSVEAVFRSPDGDCIERLAELRHQISRCAGSLSGHVQASRKGAGKQQVLRNAQAQLFTASIQCDVIQTLVNGQPDYVGHWAWQQQLRIYWQDDGGCTVCAGHARIPYGWEYLGDSALTAGLHCIATSRQLQAACACLEDATVMHFCANVAEQLQLPSTWLVQGLASTFGQHVLPLCLTAAHSEQDISKQLQVCHAVFWQTEPAGVVSLCCQSVHQCEH